MPRDKQISINALNIAMNPIHKPQYYHDLFRKIFDKKIIVKISGDKYGTLSTLTYVNNRNRLEGMYGYFYKYTKLQFDKWYDLRTEQFASVESLKTIKIPDNLVPNVEKFIYIFYPNGHRLVFQSKDGRHRFSPKLARKMFESFFNDERIVENNLFVAVSLEQSETSLNKILGLPVLSKMEITINRPNPDLDNQDEEEVYRRMDEQNVRRWKTTLTAPSKENISPDSETKKLLNVALSNGKIDAIGYDEEGMRLQESSLDHPLEDRYTYNPEKEDFVGKFIVMAKQFISSFLG